MIQAAIGDTVEVQTIHGKESLEIPEGTQFGSTFRLKEKGIQKLKSSARGDHYVYVKVVVPTGLTKDQKAQLEAIRHSFSGNPLTYKPRKEKKVFFEKIRDFFSAD